MAVATDPWQVTLNGAGYQLDLDSKQFRHESAPMIRQQSDTGDKPGESSLNPAGLWRRAQESWHHGAGQSWLDRKESDPFRFDTSKGVDPWDKYGLSLLPATAQGLAAAGTNLFMAASGGRLYVVDGAGVKVTGVGNTTFAAATGLPGGTILSCTSDGSNMYVGYAGSNIYRASGTVFAAYASPFGPVKPTELLGYVKGRLMAAYDETIANVLGGAVVGMTYNHPNVDWTWTCFGEGPNHILAGGYAGDKSAIYKTEVKADGTALDTPTLAVSLPDGEIARSVTGYLGYVVIGTDLGVRFAVADADGNLTLGALISTESPVMCAEGQDRFAWYGLTNYDATATGLGRLDLSTFTSDLTPAYASDLMVTAQGTVQAAATYGGERWFTISGLGAYKETTSKVTAGTLTTGRITYDLPDNKTVLKARVHHDPLPAATSVALAVAVDTAAATTVGTSDVDGASTYDGFAAGLPLTGASFEITATLTGDVTLRRITLLADPIPDRTEFIRAPLLLADTVTNGAGDQAFDVAAAYDALMALWRSRTVVPYKEGDKTWQVVVDDYQWVPDEPTSKPGYWTGTFLATLKAVG